MKKYLWIILFFVTTLSFAQPNAAINQANADNNLVIQLVDSKLVNFDNKIAAVAQSNQDGIADLKARTDEKLADKFKQLDDKSGYVGWWLNVLGIWLTLIGLLAPIGAFLLNRKIDKNIKDSQIILGRETKQAVEQIENKLKEADKLVAEMKGFHRNAEISVSEIEGLANKVNNDSLTPEDIQKLENDSNDLKSIPENELTASDWFIRGLNAQEQKDHYEAITYYNKVIQLNKKEDLNSPVYSNRGVAKFKLGLYHDAIKDYDLAIKLSDRNYQAYFNRALANKKLEDNKLALKDYDKAIEVNPHSSDAYNNRGVIKFDLGNYDGAIADYNKAIQLNENDADGYNNRGLVHFKLEDYSKALSDFSQAIKLNQSKPDAYINRGALKSKLGQNEEAIKDYDKAIKLDSKSVGAYYNKARAYELMKNKMEALNWLEKALQLDYLVKDVLKDEDWKDYLDDTDFKDLIAKYNKQ